MTYQELKAHVGFTKNPDRPGNSDEAFLGFLSFASGDSDAAKAIRLVFTKDYSDVNKTPEQTAAAFIDWLIVNQWGEEQRCAGVSA